MEKIGLTIEQRIEAEIYGFPGVISVFADDLKGHSIRIYPNEIYETGSVIKAYILGVLCYKKNKGETCFDDSLEYKESHYVNGSGILKTCHWGNFYRIEDLANWMIICSDNIATNMIIDYLGIDEINRCIHQFGFQHTELLNDLHFDQYHQLGNTTPEDYGQFYISLLQGTFVNKQVSNDVISILKKQQLNKMLVSDFAPYLIDSEQTGKEIITLASKSGSMNQARNDGGIVFTPNGNYVITIFTKGFQDILEYHRHPSIIYGAKVSRLILDYYLTLGERNI